MYLVLLGILLPAAVWLTPAAAQTGSTEAERVLSEMRQAFQASNADKLASLLPKMQGHTLEPLAAYWTLRARLNQASPDEIRAFLTRYADSYYEDRLRNDWLLQLGKNRDWANFRQEAARFRMNDDREVKCYALLADRATASAQTAEEAKSLWLAQRRADEGCAALADALIDDRLLSADIAWQRARWGMENNQSSVATQAVGLLDTAWLPMVNAIYNDPARYLDEKVTAFRMRTKELVTLALIRLAVRDPEAAATEASRLRWKTQLTEEELAWVWGVIGKRAALRLSPDAPAHFAKAANRHLNDDLLGWKARAALRAGDWAEARAAIEAMGRTTQAEPLWVYWRARALQALAGDEGRQQARALYEQIAGTGGFYEQLALEQLGQQTVTPPRPAPLTAAEKAWAREHPGLRRAIAAIDMGLRSEGVREWNYEIALHVPGGLPDRQLLAAADLACEREIWDRCINTSKRTREEVDHAQRFPMPFKEAVVRRSREIGLDPAYVYGLIRQESRFIMNARSHVGASGLMQVMPATASWTARRIGLTDFKPAQITDRDTNITIGTAYLKLALDDFEGSMAMAAAAYNAGPGRPRNWRNGPPLEAAIWIENIPFDETRDYVKRVLSNATNYAALLTGQPQRLTARLGTIGPRQVSARAPITDLP